MIQILKKIFLTLILLSFVSISAQEYQISGTISGQNDKPLEFIEVSLLSSDSVKIASDLTDGKGIFNLKVTPGKYILKAKQLQSILLIKDITINSSHNLGVLKIERIKALQEVIITNKKRLIERKIDRLVFNVENSVSATGGDAIDILNITPGLQILNDKITMTGKSSMNVMVNERLINLSGDDLINFLRNFKSGEIKSIEVITSPPAKYDAQGNSGLINIITKTIRKDSFNGSITTSLSQADKSYGTGGISLNYQKDKLTMTGNGSYMNGSFEPYQEYKLLYPDYIWNEQSHRRNFINSLSGRFTVDYKINSKVRIGGEYSVSDNKPLTKSINESFIYNYNNALDSLVSNNSRLETKRLTNSINIYSVINLDSLGKKINIDFDYLNYKSDMANDFYNKTYSANGDEKPNSYFSANNNSNLDVDIITAKVDIDNPTKWANLNYGLKLTFIENNSDVSFYNTTTGSPVPNLLQTNAFIYKEQTQALYISGNKKLTDKLEIQIGLRGENTQTQGNSLTLQQINKNNYFKIFPTLFLNYSFDKHKSLSFQYNRRINRPSYNNLNPFRFYSTSFNYAEGNPFLQPYFTNNLELSLNYKNSYTMLSASFIENGFDQVTFADPSTNIQAVVPVNFYNQAIWGIFQGYSFKINDKIENNSNISVSYTQTNSKMPDTVPDVDAWSASFRTNNTYVIDKARRFKAELGFRYQSPSIAGSYKLSEFYQLDLGVKGSFWSDRLQIALNATDILETNKMTFTQIVNGIRQENFDYRDLRRLRISLTYNFGKSFKMSKKTESNKEEKGRLN
jgi:outer membrane receptor protein involved in Fe transport